MGGYCDGACPTKDLYHMIWRNPCVEVEPGLLSKVMGCGLGDHHFVQTHPASH